MQITPRERRWVPPSPEERLRLQEESERMREEYAARRRELRPMREAVLRTGPALRDLDAAAECSCGCHPSPGDPQLHAHGVRCPCQATPEERHASLDELLAGFAELRDDTDHGTVLAELAQELGVELRLECLGAPLVIAGLVDGRGCFLRERHGSFRIEVAPDEDPLRDVWNADAEECSLVLMEGSEEQLTPLADEHFLQRPARLLVDVVRAFLLQRACPHPGMRAFCPECGMQATQAST